MGKSIGIDLGGTKAAAAVVLDGRSTIIPNRDGDFFTPSVVGVDEGRILVGKAALQLWLASPEDEVRFHKALLGSEQGASFKLGDRVCTPTEIASIILKQLKEDAESYLGESVDAAVVAVPAHFTERQRAAIREATELAGLRPERLLDEGTAACIASGLDTDPSENTTVLVYDLGGTKCAVTLLTVVGGIYAQLAADVSQTISGDSFDAAVVDHILRHVTETHGIDPSTSSRFIAALRQEATRAKERVSLLPESQIRIPRDLKDAADGIADVEISFSRHDLESLIAEKVQESVTLARQTLLAGDLTSEGVDRVLLVGGSTKIPFVREALASEFQEDRLMLVTDPQGLAALGAAMVAARTEQSSASTSVDLAKVTGVHYGIQAADDRFEIVIPKGSRFPSPEPVIVRLLIPQDNLSILRVPIYAGVDPVASKNELQTIISVDLPSGVRRGTSVEVAIALDGDGILEMAGVEVIGHPETKLRVLMDRCLSPEPSSHSGGMDQPLSKVEANIDSLMRPVYERLDAFRLQTEDLRSFDEQRARQLLEISIAGIDALRRGDLTGAGSAVRECQEVVTLAERDLEWKQRSGRILGFAEAVLQFGFLLDPQGLKTLRALSGELRASLHDNDQAHTRLLSEALDRATDDLPARVYAVFALIAGMNRARSEKMEREAYELESALGRIGPGGDAEIDSVLESVLPTLRRVDVQANTPAQTSSYLSGPLHSEASLQNPRSSNVWYSQYIAAALRKGASEAGTKSSRPDPEGTPEVPTSRIDRVHFAVAAPAAVQISQEFIVDVWAHLEKERKEVERLVRATTPNPERPVSIRPKGPFPIARGATLYVRLHFDDLHVEQPEDTILWKGTKGNASFVVSVPATVPPGQRIGVVTVNCDGRLQIARVPFQVLVVPAPVPFEQAVHHMQRVQTAFASYASKDREEVLHRVQGMQKVLPDLEVFLDVTSLRSGEDWEKRLWQEIPRRDVFYLFWSRSAKHSPWVEKEWRCALETRGLSFIDPVPLEPPEIAEPPAELSQKHFNDWVLAYRATRASDEDRSQA